MKTIHSKERQGSRTDDRSGFIDVSSRWWRLWPWHILVNPSDRIPNLSVSYLSPRHKRRVKVSWTVHFISYRHVLPVQQEISFLQKNWWLAVYYERSTIHHIPNTRMHFWLYPSMHWAGGVCIPTCTGQGVYPSMHWAGEVSAWGVSARGCLTGVCVADTPPGPEADTPCGQTDTCENITFANFVCGR